MIERRKHELPEAAAGIDEPGREGTLVRRHTLGDHADQHREAAGAGTGRGQYTDGDDQREFVAGEWRERRAQGEQQRAREQHRIGPIPVGEGAEGGLRRAPDELAHRQREAHRGVADLGAIDDRSNEQPQRLPHSHGDHENRRRGRHEQQGAPVETRRRVGVAHAAIFRDAAQQCQPPVNLIGTTRVSG